MKLLPPDAIAERLRPLSGWSLAGNAIRRTYVHKDFPQAMGFVNAVALLAERAHHHPDIDIRWNTVTLSLSTHSEGGLTEKDFNLATEIDAS
jgi:4a-hydroxytetrahydrobiopterin dehydratase